MAKQIPADKWVDPTSIVIPADRQREKAEPDEGLRASITRHGILNPLIIHSNNELVAGERRLATALELKLTQIPVRVFETLTPIERHEIELQENLARKQLTWQEEVKAVGDYHWMRVQGFPGWTQMGTAEALGLSNAWVSRIMAIHAELGDDDVRSCPTINGAFNLITSRAERAKMAAISRGLIAADTVAGLMPNIPVNATKEERTAALLQNMDLKANVAKTVDDLDKGIQAIEDGRKATAALEAARKMETVHDLIHTGDFLDWAETYEGPKFDVIHADFPYGKGYSGARTRRTGKKHICPVYADDADVYLGLVEGFLNLQDRFAFPAAHCLFWFDMSYYQWTIDQFKAAGWALVTPFPYLWMKGYQGIASDVKRRPRHCYETALLFSRGDRKLTKLDRDYYECGVDEKLHLNQKPLAMLKHFLSMFVDEHSAVLDPTCGSGSALAAAKLLKAERIMGCEIDPNNAEVARLLLQRHHVTEEIVDE